MIYYFLLLNKHKNLSFKRKSDYERNKLIKFGLIFFSILPLILLFIPTSKEDIEIFSAFLLPVLLILDLSFRFLFKKNLNAAIFPYLTMPIARKTLILYMIFSDLPRFWIWGCFLIYGIILWYCGVLIFPIAITLLFLILLNNYLITFIKALIGGYAILTYPVCLILIFGILLMLHFLNPFIVIPIIAVLVVVAVTALFFTLEENLHEELNLIAL